MMNWDYFCDGIVRWTREGEFIEWDKIQQPVWFDEFYRLGTYGNKYKSDIKRG